MNVLFICTMNLDRSPTAERLLAGRPGVEVRSAGTHGEAHVPLTAVHIAWADAIAVMEKAHVQALTSRFAVELAGKTLVNLDIPDVYGGGEQALVEILQERIALLVEPLLGR